VSEILRWSNWSLATLQQCGEKFRRMIIEREYTASTVGATRGKAVDSVVNKTMTAKKETGRNPRVDEAKDLAADAFETAWQEGVKLNEEEQAEGPGKVRAQAKDTAVALSGLHAGVVAPVITPIAVQHEIIIKPRGVDFEIKGRIDLIDAWPEGEVIRDTKTSEKAPPKDAADKSQQLTMFAMIRSAETKQLPKALILDQLWRTPKDHELNAKELRTSRSVQDIEALAERLNTGVEAVKRGVFMPTNPENWWCSKAWCPFWDSCIYVQGRKAKT